MSFIEMIAGHLLLHHGGELVYFLIQFNFIFGLNYSKIKSKIDVILYGTVILTIILIGERFTGILYSFFFFFMPILVNNKK
ncbi:hypothetical protein E0H82_15240 [Acinetobacter sp. ANC 4910]|uniref:hypothetical protein n=1 Tax=Acinetobacter sp. ANC 4910 TaxID=2529850 RepID=UPI00103A43E1|nr:hypothetical protein [Acinetobacter sp. ANC 4910]TCB32280.1 hypothetical protein E0H82_15240 [Acinetobacter sp. ANC 4910]